MRPHYSSRVDTAVPTQNVNRPYLLRVKKYFGAPPAAKGDWAKHKKLSPHFQCAMLFVRDGITRTAMYFDLEALTPVFVQDLSERSGCVIDTSHCRSHLFRMISSTSRKLCLSCSREFLDCLLQMGVVRKAREESRRPRWILHAQRDS